MSRYSYNNIIIIATNVIILAIYSARFVHLALKNMKVNWDDENSQYMGK